MNYIICSGGLGNQMFQYAFYYTQKKRKSNIKFDISYFMKNNIHNGFELKRCFGITDYVNIPKNISGLNLLNYKLSCLFRKQVFFNIKRERMNKYINKITWNNSIIYGYWQSVDFFKKNIDEIKSVYTFCNISPKNIELAHKMKDENSIAIHIRRGDYLNAPQYINLSETNYYIDCIKIIEEKVDNLKYYIFSDDPEWCKKSGLFPLNATIVDWNNGENSYQDMYLIKNSKYCVTANSTFSWWAAFLGDHIMVFRPSLFKTDWNELKTNKFYPDDWICVEVNL